MTDTAGTAIAVLAALGAAGSFGVAAAGPQVRSAAAGRQVPQAGGGRAAAGHRRTWAAR